MFPKVLLCLCLFSTSAFAGVLDPSAFADESDLTNAYSGVTLSLVNPPNPSNFVSNFTYDIGTLFGIHQGSYVDMRWQNAGDSEGLFRADFDTATDFVSIETASTGANDVYSVLEAYDSNDNLLQTFQTGLHSGVWGDFVTMSINRVTNDISYIIAYGDSLNPLHDGVVLMNMSFNEFTGGGGGAAVPEPSTYALMCLGLLSLGYFRYRRK